MNNYKRVKHKNDEYAIFSVQYNGTKLPVLMDYNDCKIINKMKKTWKCNNNGFIYCNNNKSDVYLHELIMSIQNKESGMQYSRGQNKPIIHINRIGLDNRRDNLAYDIVDKSITKNIKKKKRTITLPKMSGLDPDNIPTYIWYMKPDSSHGERFVINIGDINWKTTSSNELSLTCKLEEAKMYLRNLLRNRPDLQKEYSMNGDFNKEGKQLSKSYYDIVHADGYTYIKRVIPNKNTMDLLQPNYDFLSRDEKGYLYYSRKNIKQN
jgi:hypothetical protein